MFIVEKGETLVLRLTQPVSNQRIVEIRKGISEIFADTGVKFVLLDGCIEPCAIQKDGE